MPRTSFYQISACRLFYAGLLKRIGIGWLILQKTKSQFRLGIGFNRKDVWNRLHSCRSIGKTYSEDSNHPGTNCFKEDIKKKIGKVMKRNICSFILSIIFGGNSCII